MSPYLVAFRTIAASALGTAAQIRLAQLTGWLFEIERMEKMGALGEAYPRRTVRGPVRS